MLALPSTRALRIAPQNYRQTVRGARTAAVAGSNPRALRRQPRSTKRSALFVSSDEEAVSDVEAPGGSEAAGADDPHAIVGDVINAIYGHLLPGAVTTVTRLGVADALGSHELSLSDLAAEVGVTDAGGLFRLMRFLVSKGFFTQAAASPEATEPAFANNARSSLLQRDAPGSLWGHARHCADAAPTWSKMSEFLRRDGDAGPASPFEMFYGKDFFSWLAATDGRVEEFSHAMSAIAAPRTAVVQQIDASLASRPGDVVVDVGGAEGGILDLLLASRDQARGVLFDLPHVVAGARDKRRARADNGSGSGAGPSDAALEDRVEYVGGDFFDAATLPKGASLYVLAKIVHDWNDADVVRILRNVRQAMDPAGAVVILELVVPEDIQQDTSNSMMLDLTMLDLTPGGRERTREEFESLCTQAGLQLGRVEAPVPGLDAILYTRRA